MDRMQLAILNEAEIGSGGTHYRLPSAEPELTVGRGIAWMDPPPIGLVTFHSLRDPETTRTRVEISIEGC